MENKELKGFYVKYRKQGVKGIVHKI